MELAHQARVETAVHASREAAGEDAHRRALGEVQQLVHEQLELALGDARAALVDLRLLAGGGVHDRRGHARLLADADEVVEDRLVGELLDDPDARGAARDAGGDHRLAQRLQGPCHVHPLAARHRRLLHRAVAAAQAEVRDGERLVDRRVERDRDDHALLRVMPARGYANRRARAFALAAPGVAAPLGGCWPSVGAGGGSPRPARPASSAAAARSGSTAIPSVSKATRSGPAPGTSAAVTSRTRRTTWSPRRIVIRPTGWPAGSSPSSSSGASTLVRTRWPRRVDDDRVVLGHQADALVEVLDLRAGHRLGLVQRLHAPELGQPVAQQSHRLAVARRLAGLAEHHADHPRAKRPSRRAHQHVARRPGVAGLHAVDEVVLADEVVAVVHDARLRARLEVGHGLVHDRREAPVSHQSSRQRRQVTRAGVIRGVVEPDRVCVAGVREAQLGARARSCRARRPPATPTLPAASVTAASFALSSRRASRRSSTRMRSPGAQVDLRLHRQRVVGRRPVHVPRLGAFEGEQGGHQLRGARDRPALVGIALEHHAAVARIDQDRRLSPGQLGAPGALLRAGSRRQPTGATSTARTAAIRPACGRRFTRAA